MIDNLNLLIFPLSHFIKHLLYFLWVSPFLGDPLCFWVVHLSINPDVCPDVKTFLLMRYLKDAMMDFAQIQQHHNPRGKDELIKFWSHHDLIEVNGIYFRY